MNKPPKPDENRPIHVGIRLQGAVGKNLVFSDRLPHYVLTATLDGEQLLRPDGYGRG